MKTAVSSHTSRSTRVCFARRGARRDALTFSLPSLRVVYLHTFQGGVEAAWINTTGEPSEWNTNKRRSVLSSKHRLCYHSLSTRHFPFQEASSINKSLSALGNVIMALVDITHGKTRHVHYRDSKLTFLLRVSSFFCLCKNPLPLTSRDSVCYSSHPGFHFIKWPWVFKLFLGEQRRISKQRLISLGVCQFVVQKKTRIIGKNITSLFFIACPPTVFSPRIWQHAKRKERNVRGHLWERRGLLSALLNVNALSWLPPRSQYQLRWTNDVHRTYIFSFLHPHSPRPCS